MITITMISHIHQLLRLLGFTSKCAMFLIDDVFYKQLAGNKFSIFLEDNLQTPHYHIFLIVISAIFMLTKT